MNQIEQECNKMEENVVQEGKQDQWNIFKKYPNVSILPLPKRQEQTKVIKSNTPNLETNNPLITYQTLFKQQLGINNDKLKTMSSQVESNY